MKKRILSLICVLAMLMAIALPVSAFANVKHRYVYTQNGGELNMRKAPVAHANNKIQGIPYGAEVLVESYVNNGTWAYVSYKNIAGYVMTRYLVTEKPASGGGGSPGSTTDTEVSYKGFTHTTYYALVRANTPGGYVNLRWGPSKSTPVQNKVYDGASLTVIAQNDFWAQVRDDSTGAVGFMMRSFLSTVNSGGAIGTGATVK